MGWVDQGKQQAELMASQEAYCKAICAWLSQHFPDLVADELPHPAAVAAVIQLHAIHGKGTLTVDDHGSLIRGHVAWWDAKLEDVAA